MSNDFWQDPTRIPVDPAFATHRHSHFSATAGTAIARSTTVRKPLRLRLSCVDAAFFRAGQRFASRRLDAPPAAPRTVPARP
jgi:hypothetical protein